MRLVSFAWGSDESCPAGQPRAGTGSVGVVVGDEIVDLTDPVVGLTGDMVRLLEAGPDALAVARSAWRTKARRVPVASARLLAPVPRPPKVLAIGQNYAAHVAELGGQPPQTPVFFNKQRTCIVGPGEGIEVPLVSDQVDYEGELAMVIGTRCRHVPAHRAAEVVAGFTILNDVSVRDWQWRSPTWTLGKSFDTHGPTGPWIVTTDELGDPHRLGLRTEVNAELRQQATTDDMIFTCWQQIEHLTTAFTLEPGDIVSTGTPAGVGASFDPPRWLRPGDTVRITIEGIGSLVNPVVAEAVPQNAAAR